MKTADQTTIEQPSRDWTINRFCSETGIPYNSLKDRLTRSGHAPERGSRFTLRELIDALSGDDFRRWRAEAAVPGRAEGWSGWRANSNPQTYLSAGDRQRRPAYTDID